MAAHQKEKRDVRHPPKRKLTTGKQGISYRNHGVPARPRNGDVPDLADWRALYVLEQAAEPHDQVNRPDDIPQPPSLPGLSCQAKKCHGKGCLADGHREYGKEFSGVQDLDGFSEVGGRDVGHVAAHAVRG